jgi:hypothetical protein
MPLHIYDTETSGPHAHVVLDRGDPVRVDWRDRWAYGIITDYRVPSDEERTKKIETRIYVDLARSGGVWIGIGAGWPTLTRCSILEVLAWAAGERSPL